MKKARAGFTLLELLIVVTIIAIIGAIGMPNLRRDRPQVRDAARVVMADLNRARSEAIRLNATVSVTIDTAGGFYRSFLDNDRNGVPDDGQVIFRRALTSDFPLTNVVSASFSNSSTALWFDVRGLPRNANGGFSSGNVTLRSKHDAGYQLRVLVSSGGRVRLERVQ